MSEYVESFDIWITQQKMPLRVRAFCRCLGDENCVVLNQDLSEDRKLEAVAHEVLHFKRNDLFKRSSVEEIEGALTKGVLTKGALTKGEVMLNETSH